MSDDIKAPLTKAGVTLAGAAVSASAAPEALTVPVTQQGQHLMELAATMGVVIPAIIGALTLGEFGWKKVLRPLLERLGWIKRRTRYTRAEWAAIVAEEAEGNTDRAKL